MVTLWDWGIDRCYLYTFECAYSDMARNIKEPQIMAFVTLCKTNGMGQKFTRGWYFYNTVKPYARICDMTSYENLETFSLICK